MSAASPAWASWDDERLLALPVAKLGLRLETSPLRPRVERLFRELERKGLAFRPHLWLSSAFFSADGVPGIGVPFLLAHPRLVRLERAQVAWAEGAGEAECLRILRHETGHAIDTAFALSRRADWRAAFGLRSAPYRQSFRADPHSGDHVRYLPRWYAQSHPAEDFAETFAVWLDPGSRWRSRYPDRGATSRARRKLELVDAMMGELRGRRPTVTTRERVEPLSELRETIGEHFRRRRRRRLAEPRAPFEERLTERFEVGRAPTGPRAGAQRSAVAARLDALRPELVKRLAGRTNARASAHPDAYSVHQVLDGMVLFARERGLRLKGARDAPSLSLVRGLVVDSLDELRRGRWHLAR